MLLKTKSTVVCVLLKLNENSIVQPELEFVLPLMIALLTVVLECVCLGQQHGIVYNFNRVCVFVKMST